MKNIHSAKTQDTPPTEDKPMEKLETHSNHAYADIIDTQQWIATNITGRLQVTSNRVNKYLFILYEYDSNSILVHQMKKWTDKEFICVFQDLHGHLTTS